LRSAGTTLMPFNGQFQAGFEPASDELKFVALPLSYRGAIFGGRTHHACALQPLQMAMTHVFSLAAHADANAFCEMLTRALRTVAEQTAEL
jgi:hypothetical protein